MADTFWTTSAAAPPERVLGLDSPGDALTDPVGLIRGADGTSIDSPQLTADAEALFPTWDADGTLISSRPADYAADVSAEAFARWHAAHQLAWMAEHGTTTTRSDGDGDVTFVHATLGDAAEAGLNLQVLLSADRAEVLTLNYLEPPDIARLPLADQRALTLHPAWDDVVTSRHLLIPSGGQTAAEARAEAAALIEDVRSTITGSDSYLAVVAASGLTAAEVEAAFEADATTRATYWPVAFTRQLDLMLGGLDAMAAFDVDAIEERVAEFAARYERVERIASMTEEEDATPLPRGVNAVDGGAGISSAFDALVDIELRIHDLAVAAAEVIESGTYEGAVLDTPGMIFVLQTLTNYRKEAEAEAMSEDLDQRNALLEDYEAMQSLVTATLGAYTSDGDTDETRTIGDAADLDELEEEGVERVVAMFDADLAETLSDGTANSFHPGETAKGVVRPTEAMVSGSGALTGHAKEVWDGLGLNLSEATGTLGRDNQEVMDEINALNSEKNRHYELASGTLNKMTSLLRSIVNA